MPSPIAFLSTGLSLTLSALAQAAEPSGHVPTKAPPTAFSDWSGFYTGAHLGEAWGRGQVTAWEVGGGVAAVGTPG